MMRFRPVVVLAVAAILLFSVSTAAMGASSFLRSQPHSVHFGRVMHSTPSPNVTVTVTNVSNGDVNVSNSSLTAPFYNVDIGSTCLGVFTLHTGESCAWILYFVAPVTPGKYSGTMTMPTNLGDFTFDLSGTSI